MAAVGLWPIERPVYFSDNSEMLGKVKIVTNRSAGSYELPEIVNVNGVTFEK